MLFDYGTFGGMRIEGETEALEENPPQCHLVHNKSHITLTGMELGPWEAGDWEPELWP